MPGPPDTLRGGGGFQATGSSDPRSKPKVRGSPGGAGGAEPCQTLLKFVKVTILGGGGEIRATPTPPPLSAGNRSGARSGAGAAAPPGGRPGAPPGAVPTA